MHHSDPLSTHFRIDELHKKALSKLGISTIFDLLYHLPTRYEDISAIQSVGGLTVGGDAVVYGKVGGLKTRKTWKGRRPISEGWVEDGSARIKIMWFNQPYIAKMLVEGVYVKLAGRVSGTAEKPYLSNPEIEIVGELPIDRHDSLFKGTEQTDETLYPVYREVKGVTSKWMYHTIQKCFKGGVLETLEDPLPESLVKKYNLPNLRTALVWIHAPKKAEHTETARKRFAFEEIFYIQIVKQQERAQLHREDAYQIHTEASHIEEFTKRFAFSLTRAQDKAIREILTNFESLHPMSRLLEGDVGSGKTAVAATTAYAVATSHRFKTKSTTKHAMMPESFANLQVAYMAPTEILARQHFESFIKYFEHLPISVGLITGSGCMKFPSKVDPKKPTELSRAQLLKWVKSGEIPILIGTHALIQKSVSFKHLAYVIIDEQHRFGTNQRRLLAKKDESEGKRLPHLLSMTATPIPRTLALTIYGDLDLSLLDEMPVGRKPIITRIVKNAERKEVYEAMKKELRLGRQAYVICPRIDEPDPTMLMALQAKSVKAEMARLKKEVFKEYRLGILHSKMSPKEKEETMRAFLAHDIDILVATSVVEVGVNVPNATVILIEGAERFGLSQLHQLRGRVIRSNDQAYCFALTESESDKTIARLKALATAKNGFELAEYDLAQRGSGELYGGKQWGLTDLGMDAIKNIKMVEAARNEAANLIKEDPELKKHPLILKRSLSIGETLHLE
ncbi:ATP-dependent DNA helicase RecG [Patescibacteria group bacterium]|nr:ATP-dependent DNA helicase RecG [Patescibacteria group bacterium]